MQITYFNTEVNNYYSCEIWQTLASLQVLLCILIFKTKSELIRLKSYMTFLLSLFYADSEAI